MARAAPPPTLARATLALALSACVSSPTEIVLVVHTDLKSPDDYDALEVVAEGSAGAAPLVVPVGPGVSPPFTVGLRAAGEPGPLNVEVRAIAGDSFVVAQRARTAFFRGESRVLAMELLAGCRGFFCPADFTCGPSGCKSEQIPWLPPWTGQIPAPPLDTGPRVDAGPIWVVELADDFDDGRMDPVKWVVGAASVDAESFSTSQKVVETEGVLRIQPHTDRGTKAYSGYVSARRFDLAGADVIVEVPEVAIRGAQTVFALDTPTGGYAFRTRWSSVIVRNLLVFEESGVAGAEAESHRPDEHRFWRFRHDAEAQQLHWELGRSLRGPWAAKRSTAATSAQVSSVAIALYAGTAESISPPVGFARFDNVLIRRAGVRQALPAHCV